MNYLTSSAEPFLNLTGFSGDQLVSLNAVEWVTLGNPVTEAPGLISCVVRTSDTEKFLTGHAALGDDGSVYLSRIWTLKRVSVRICY
jgi:hypothetical protein